MAALIFPEIPETGKNGNFGNSRFSRSPFRGAGRNGKTGSTS
jgi:hypothetical protein